MTTTAYASYAWIITRDLITPDRSDKLCRVGVTGPRNVDPSLLATLPTTDDALSGHAALRWRTLDDDGEVYHEGWYVGATPSANDVEHGSDESPFAPLWDMSQPDAGATEIQYRVGGKWVTL